jgi:hypothetical protein
MLELVAAGGAKPIPQPVEYWRRNLMCVVGRISKAETEEVLFALEEAALVTSALDPLGVRRFSVTPGGLKASLQIKG